MHSGLFNKRSISSITFTVLIVFLGIARVSGQASGAAKADDPAPLVPGQTQTRECGKDADKYRFTLPAGSIATVRAKEITRDLSLTLRDKDLKTIAEIDSQYAVDSSESVDIVAEAESTFVVEVACETQKGRTGAYSITLTEPKPAAENDKVLFKALRDDFEALDLHYNVSLHERAQELAIAALAAREHVLGRESELVADSLVSLGRIYASKNKHTDAEAALNRALTAYEKSVGKGSRQYAFTLYMLSRVAFSRGELKASESYILDALKILEKTRDGGGVRTAGIQSTLGLVYRSMTDFRRGELAFRKALETCERTVGEEHAQTASVLNNLGLMYYAAGDYPNAEKALERSVAIIERLQGADNRDVAIGLNNLGLVAWRKLDYEKAEAIWQRALTIFEKANGPESDGVANVLGNLGIIYKEHYKDFRKAEAAQKRSLAIVEKLSGTYSMQAGVATASLALVYRSLGDFVKAEEYALRAQEIYERSIGPNHQNVVLNYAVLAQLAAMRGDIAGSLSYQKRIEAIESMGIQVNLVIGSERQKIAYFSRLRNTDRNISFMVNLAPANAEARDLVISQILQRKGRILDALSQNLSDFRTRGGKENEALLARLNEVTSDLSKLTSEGRKGRTETEYQASVNKLLLEREQIEAEVSRRTAGSYVPTKPVQLSEVRQAIPAGSALIEFAVYRPFEWNYREGQEPNGEPRYIAFVMPGGAEVGWVDLGDAKAIDASITALRAALRDPQRRDVQQLARDVDRRVMEPLRPLLSERKHVIVSPDGELNLVPFEALVDESKRYLAEHYSFTYVSSGRDLLRRPSEPKNKDLLIIANPAFGLPPSGFGTARQSASSGSDRVSSPSLASTLFSTLAGTARESTTIKEIFPNATVLSGRNATETALKQARAPEILHIATHGFFLDANADSSQKTGGLPSDNPLLRSGLAFAGANTRPTSGDDGIMTALEASGLDLWGTKLVVLSACDTGLGEVRNGEGVYGLRRSFVLSGAESLVMSLWPISDAATREMMASYYQNLKNGMGRGEGLRHVRLQMLKREDRRHPFYWASFIQSGEWANLEGIRQPLK